MLNDRIQQRPRPPTDRHSQERACNHIREPVVVADHDGNGQQNNSRRAGDPPSRLQDPEHRKNRKGNRGRSRGKSVPVSFAMQKMEAVEAISNKRRIDPAAAEDALQDDFRCDGPPSWPTNRESEVRSMAAGSGRRSGRRRIPAERTTLPLQPGGTGTARDSAPSRTRCVARAHPTIVRAGDLRMRYTVQLRRRRGQAPRAKSGMQPCRS